MQIYLVGGAVRDSLLGLPVADRDWVVVGATPQQMLDQGYLPVGRDFPVFLHPRTREEYALARTERKTAPGYRGFAIHAAPDVTLEQDLARRDLTINAMALPAAQVPAVGAIDAAHAHLIDPWNGRADLRQQILRHVTGAFREDPVRILRVARFAARWPGFRVAPATLALMQDMVAQGEARSLVAERVWQELARGLMAECPSRLCTVLQDCGAWEAVLPELCRIDAPEAMPRALAALGRAAAAHAPLPVRHACLCLPLASLSSIAALGARLRVPSECQALVNQLARHGAALEAAAALDATGLLALLERCDALRKPGRFLDMLQALECLAGHPPAAPPRLVAALAAARGVATQAIAEAAGQDGLQGVAIGERVRAARVAAIGLAT